MKHFRCEPNSEIGSKAKTESNQLREKIYTSLAHLNESSDWLLFLEPQFKFHLS